MKFSKKCYKEDCDKPIYGLLRCQKHYTRFYKYGDDEFVKQAPPGVALTYFNEMLDVIDPTNHIIWPYAKIKGYGVAYFNSKKEYVHRVALLRRMGQPPTDKASALHKPNICHEPACFNYKHLYWGNAKDNAGDRKLDNTENQGEKQGMSKLKNEQVLRIFRDDRPYKKIAEQYKVCVASIHNIKKGKSWGWLTAKEEICQ